METARRTDGKRMLKEKISDEMAMIEDFDSDYDCDSSAAREEEINKRRRAVVTPSSGGGRRPAGGGSSSSSSSSQPPCCQVEDCSADMAAAKTYHRRHKVCELHAKASAVIIAGIPQRFCQQCSRFHELSEFDEFKRSCRRRLAGHNERRRRTPYDPRGGDGST